MFTPFLADSDACRDIEFVLASLRTASLGRWAEAKPYDAQRCPLNLNNDVHGTRLEFALLSIYVTASAAGLKLVAGFFTRIWCDFRFGDETKVVSSPKKDFRRGETPFAAAKLSRYLRFFHSTKTWGSLDHLACCDAYLHSCDHLGKLAAPWAGALILPVENRIWFNNL